jgi:hypothetical protein
MDMVKDLDLTVISEDIPREVMETSVDTLLGDMKTSEVIHQVDMEISAVMEISEVIRRGVTASEDMNQLEDTDSEATNQLEDTKISEDIPQVDTEKLEDMAVTLMASEDMNSEDMVDTNQFRMDSEDKKAVTEDSTLKLVDMEEVKNIHSVVS